MRRKVNHLTRESQQIERSAIRATKPSADAVCEAWARWKAQQTGVVIPGGAKMQFAYPNGWETMTAEFVFETIHSAWSEAQRGPRGGFRKPLYHPRRVEREVVAMVPLPPYAQPVRDALAWHAEHQANPIRDLIPYQK